MGTWLADRLPTALTLIISGPDHAFGIAVLCLLSCVCRRPICLPTSPRADSVIAPARSPTLLLDQQELKPNMLRLLRASSYQGLHLLGNRGNVIHPYCSKAIFCGNDAMIDTISVGAIHIAAAPSKLQLSTLNENVQNEIARDFQPRLLQYRLTNATKAGESPVDVSSSTAPMRPLAWALAACFPEDPDSAGETINFLRPQDESVRGQTSCSVSTAPSSNYCGASFTAEICGK